jgi:hypothetical protein
MLEHSKSAAPGEISDSTGLEFLPGTEVDATTPSPEAQAQSSGPDVFSDLAKLALAAGEIAPSEKILTLLDVRKPRREEFVRCHPTVVARINFYEDKETRAPYLIGPAVLEEMAALVGGGLRSVRLTLTATYNGSIFAWPVPIPADVKANRWHATAFAAAEEATKHWVRVVSGSGEYEVFRRLVNDGMVPVWPAEADTPEKMLRLAFSKVGGAELVNSSDHHVIRALKGIF